MINNDTAAPTDTTTTTAAPTDTTTTTTTATATLPSSALINEDFPTLLRPTTTVSGIAWLINSSELRFRLVRRRFGRIRCTLAIHVIFLQNLHQ